MPQALLYGAYGYTGELTTRIAKARGMRLVLAGRDQARTSEVAARWGMDHRVFSLDDPRAVDDALRGIDVVLHCAGPFAHTWRPMVDGCLRNRAHYLDITGEIDVFEGCASRDEEARRAGVMILPGAGFDVVPSDCLAAHVKSRLPDATHLALGFMGLGSVSHGTAMTTVENLDRGGLVRRDGALTKIGIGSLTRSIDYGQGGPRKSMAIPWGDVATAFRSTGIPNIEVYIPAPTSMRIGARALSVIGPVMGTRPVQKLLKTRRQREAARADRRAARARRRVPLGRSAQRQGRGARLAFAHARGLHAHGRRVAHAPRARAPRRCEGWLSDAVARLRQGLRPRATRRHADGRLRSARRPASTVTRGSKPSSVRARAMSARE